MCVFVNGSQRSRQTCTVTNCCPELQVWATPTVTQNLIHKFETQSVELDRCIDNSRYCLLPGLSRVADEGTSLGQVILRDVQPPGWSNKQSWTVGPELRSTKQYEYVQREHKKNLLLQGLWKPQSQIIQSCQKRKISNAPCRKII